MVVKIANKKVVDISAQIKGLRYFGVSRALVKEISQVSKQRTMNIFMNCLLLSTSNLLQIRGYTLIDLFYGWNNVSVLDVK